MLPVSPKIGDASTGYKLKQDNSTKSFTDEELLMLLQHIDDSENSYINFSESINWLRAYRTIDTQSLSIALHEEIHVFTFGENNCTRHYPTSTIEIHTMQNNNYVFQGQLCVVKSVPIYLKTDLVLKKPQDYKLISSYLTQPDMAANRYGLNGIISEYYAYVRELAFLLKYKQFCEAYDIKDRMLAKHLDDMVQACDEWQKVSDEYVEHIKVHYDGLVYKELTNTGTLAVLEKIKQEHMHLKSQEIIIEFLPDNAPNITPKEKPASILEIIFSFWDKIYAGIMEWAGDFFGIP